MSLLSLSVSLSNFKMMLYVYYLALSNASVHSIGKHSQQSPSPHWVLCPSEGIQALVLHPQVPWWPMAATSMTAWVSLCYFPHHPLLCLVSPCILWKPRGICSPKVPDACEFVAWPITDDMGCLLRNELGTLSKVYYQPHQSAPSIPITSTFWEPGHLQQRFWCQVNKLYRPTGHRPYIQTLKLQGAALVYARKLISVPYNHNNVLGEAWTAGANWC